MADYTVQLTALHPIADEITALSTKIHDEIHALNNNLLQYLAEWRDDAQAAYWPCQNHWTNAADDLANQASQAAQGVRDVHDVYKGAENFGLGLWTA